MLNCYACSTPSAPRLGREWKRVTVGEGGHWGHGGQRPVTSAFENKIFLRRDEIGVAKTIRTFGVLQSTHTRTLARTRVSAASRHVTVSLSRPSLRVDLSTGRFILCLLKCYFCLATGNWRLATCEVRVGFDFLPCVQPISLFQINARQKLLCSIDLKSCMQIIVKVHDFQRQWTIF